LRKSDGTTLYATRDFAAVFHRWEEYRFERCLYVVAAQQKLHFRQLKGVLARMHVPWVDRIEHVDFGLLRLPEGKMSTREGNVVFLEELLDRAVADALAIVAEKNPDLGRKDEVAEQVGIGAVIFHDLKKERIKDVVFEWSEVLSFEGETGPYVQYTHARLASILRKAGGFRQSSAVDWSLLGDAAPIALALARFPDVVRSAADQCEPSQVAQYLLALCRDVSSWYSRERVLGQEAGVTAARLALVESAKIVIGNGLRLLGVAAPEEM
jgi:arginyl-tRNA synthetase